MGCVDEKSKGGNIINSNGNRKNISQVIYFEKPIRYNYQTNSDTNRPSLSFSFNENSIFNDNEPKLKALNKVQNNKMVNNSLNLIFQDEISNIQDNNDMNYLNYINNANGINYIYDNIDDINNNIYNPEISPTNAYNIEDYNFDFQENENLDIPRDTLVIKINQESDASTNLDAYLNNLNNIEDNSNIVNDINNNYKKIQIQNNNQINLNDENIILSSKKPTEDNTKADTNNNQDLSVDNNINYSVLSEPIINFRKKKTILDNPLKSVNINNNNNIYKTKRIEKSSNINKFSTTKSIDKNIADYCNKMGFKELEDFSPDLWKKFYPNENYFFDYDKGDVIISQLKSENDLGETETYIGEVNQKGEKNGFGKLFSTKTKRIGTWRNNQFTGWGREVRDNGDIYEGRFENGELIGKGIFKNNNMSYVGDFYKFIKHGKGDLYTNNYHYRGHFFNNKIHGKGRIDIYNVGVYEGTFRNDEITGKGILMLKNGEIYEGEMKNGKMIGNGKLISKDGITYEGLFNNELIN